MAATMTSIAKEVGVSVAVVSRLLRGDPTLRISQERRQAIIRASSRLGGRIMRRARQRTNLVLVPVSRVFSGEWIRTNIVESQLYRSLEEELKQHGLRLHTVFFDAAQQDQFFENTICSSNVCDALVLLSRISNMAMADLLRACSFPHVGLAYDAERLHINTVRPNTAEGFRQAVEHLYQLGHRRIGYVGPRMIYRYPLIVGALATVGLSLDEGHCLWLDVASPDESPDAWSARARQSVAEWQSVAPAPTALLCANDLFAMAVVEGLQDRGLLVGKDVSVIGCDNLEQHRTPPAAHPILTTIDNPLPTVGQRAAQVLVNQIIHGQTQIVHEQIPIQLIVRKSTGPVETA
jgi:DNA-binding LacI/PurR family transcriptional regulator